MLDSEAKSNGDVVDAPKVVAGLAILEFAEVNATLETGEKAFAATVLVGKFKPLLVV